MNYFIESLNSNKPNIKDESFSNWKKALILCLIFLFFGTFIYKIFSFMVLDNKQYLLKAQNNFSSIKYILPDRGVIYSRNKDILAKNIPIFTVVLDLNTFDRFYTYKDISELLSPNSISFLLDNKIPISNSMLGAINNDLKLGRDYFELKYFDDEKEYLALNALLKDFGPNFNIKIIENSVRYYTPGTEFSHTLGYLSKIDLESLQKNSWYNPESKIGVSGLELYFENYLRGEKGEKTVNYDSKYSIYSTEITKPPVAGHSLITNLDLNLQLVAYNSLKKQVEKVKATGGAVVVQNPNNGEVLALVSYPAYNNNLFSRGILKTEYDSLLNDPNKPLLNRAISTVFPPGSTFKVVTALAGLQEGSITAQTVINDTGVINIGNFSYKTWKGGGHGLINVVGALKESSDIFFYILAGGHKDYPEIKALGPWKLYKWSKLFGFGQKLNIELNDEVTGFVADPEWKQNTYNEPWYVGNSYHFGIGQGFVTATPLQVNTMLNAIANNGIIFKPYIVSKIVDREGNLVKEFKPTIITNLNADSENLKIIKEGLIQASSPGGTAYPLFNYKVSVAGKTGTSEFGPPKKDGTYSTHAWFSAFAPAEKPEISVTVFLENGGGGSDNAAPIAKDIFDEFFK